jgi:hypothetical protein
MLQVFHMDITKVDQDVSYVAMVVHICCKRVFQMFHLFFKRMLQVCLWDVAYVSHICYKCFIWMLHMFFCSVLQLMYRKRT